MRRVLYLMLGCLVTSYTTLAQSTGGLVDDHVEIQVLRTLYETTTISAVWNNTTGWPTDDVGWDAITSLSQVVGWYGVVIENGDIVELRLSRNNMRGTLRANISKLTSLRVLDLSHNRLSGNVPNDWSSLTKLERLDVGFNYLEGPLPDSWSTMTNLKWMRLVSNGFEGALPSSWSALTSLKRLRIGGSPITGNLPSSWSALTELDTLMLHWTDIGGPLPESWSALTNLVYLDIDFMELEGEIPESWSSLTKLKTLWLNSNHMTGGLPDTWSTMTEMVNLHLDNNQLKDSIPDSWKAFTKLKILNLHHNCLHGDVPDYITGFHDLEQLRVNVNDFRSFPDFKNHLNAAQLTIEADSNLFDYHSLEQNLTGADMHGYAAFNYVPQKQPLDTIDTSPVELSTDLVFINNRAGGTHTHYQWQEWDGTSWMDITGATQENLTLSLASLSENGNDEHLDRWTNFIQLNIQSGIDFPSDGRRCERVSESGRHVYRDRQWYHTLVCCSFGRYFYPFRGHVHYAGIDGFYHVLCFPNHRRYRK